MWDTQQSSMTSTQNSISSTSSVTAHLLVQSLGSAQISSSSRPPYVPSPHSNANEESETQGLPKSQSSQVPKFFQKACSKVAGAFRGMNMHGWVKPVSTHDAANHLSTTVKANSHSETHPSPKRPSAAPHHQEASQSTPPLVFNQPTNQPTNQRRTNLGALAPGGLYATPDGAIFSSGLDGKHICSTGRVVHMDLRGALKGTESNVVFNTSPSHTTHHPLCMLEYKGYTTTWEKFSQNDLDMFHKVQGGRGKQNSHLVHILGVNLNPRWRSAKVIMELMPCGSLLQILMTNLDRQVRPLYNFSTIVESIQPSDFPRYSWRLPESILSHIAYAALKAIQERRECSYAMRATMGPHSICFSPDGRIRFVDLPFRANVLNMTCNTQILVEFLSYLPPEQLLSRSRDFSDTMESMEAADVWALGVMLLEAATGYHIFLSAAEQGSMELIRSVERQNLTGIPVGVSACMKLSPVAHSFIDRCLQHDILQRGTPAELLQHEFVQCPQPYEYGEASKEMIARTKPSKSAAEGDRTRDKAVQAWLHDITTRQHSIKQLARATLEHFYWLLNTQTEFGPNSKIKKLFSEKSKLKIVDANRTVGRYTGTSEILEQLEILRSTGSIQLNTTKVQQPSSFSQSKVSCKVYGMVGKRAIKHKLLLALPITHDCHQGVRILDLMCTVAQRKAKPRPRSEVQVVKSVDKSEALILQS
jgi:serine/threonine protein kinase